MSRFVLTLVLVLLVTPRAGEQPTAKPGEVGLFAEKLAELAPAVKRLVEE